jgi:hypothetical protein
MSKIEKIRKDAAKIFKSEIPKLSNLLSGGPIKNGKPQSEETFWTDSNNEDKSVSFFEMSPVFDSISSGDIDDFSEILLSEWENYEDEEKKMLKKLIRKILQLRVKYGKLKLDSIDSEVSDFIYMMY